MGQYLCQPQPASSVFHWQLLALFFVLGPFIGNFEKGLFREVRRSMFSTRSIGRNAHERARFGFHPVFRRVKTPITPDATALCHTNWVPSLVVGICIFDCLFGWYLVVVEKPSCQKSTIWGTRLGSHDFCIVDKCPDLYGI